MKTFERKCLNLTSNTKHTCEMKGIKSALRHGNKTLQIDFLNQYKCQ